jgi:hypothetical protein
MNPDEINRNVKTLKSNDISTHPEEESGSRTRLQFSFVIWSHDQNLQFQFLYGNIFFIFIK